MADYNELLKKYGGSVVSSQPEAQPAATDANIQALIEKFGGQVQQPKEMGVGEMLGQAAYNLPSSTMRVLKETAQAITNPIESAKTVLDLGAGLLQNTLPESVVQFVGEDKKSRDLARNVGQFYADRYGSVEAAKQAFAQDPAGVLADASTVLGVGGAALPGKVGAVVSKTGRMVDPLNVAAKATTSTANLAGKLASESLGVTTGAGGESIRQAFKAGQAGGEKAKQFRENISGNVEMTDALDSAKQALANMQAEKQRVYRVDMASVNKDKNILSFEDVDNSLRAANERVKYKGQVKNKAAADKVAEVQKKIDDWKSLDPNEFHTPEGLDALKQSIGDTLESIPFEQKNARAVVGGVYNSIKSTISKQAPTYEKVMRDYQNASESIKEIERSLSLGKKASADTAMRKLQSLMRDNVNTNYGQRVKLAKMLEESGGSEFMPALAGQSLQKITPRGIQGGLAPVGQIGAYSVGGLPAAAGLAAVSSPRLVGEAAYGTGLLTRPVAKQAGAVAEVLSNEDIQRLANLMYQTQQPKGLLE